MLDIQGGQSNPAVQAVTPQPAPVSPVPQGAIPSIGSNAAKLTEWTAIIVVLLVILAGGYLSFVLSSTQADLATQNRKLNDLKTQLGTPERTKTDAIATQLKAGAAAVQAAIATPSPWSGFLKELTQRIPSGVVLTNLSSGDHFAIRMSGTATTYEDLAQLLTALQSSSQFSDVTLESGSQGDTGNGTSGVTFSIKATYVAPKVATIAGDANGGH